MTAIQSPPLDLRILRAVLALRALPGQGRGREELLERLLLETLDVLQSSAALLAWPRDEGVRLLYQRASGERWEEDHPVGAEVQGALRGWLRDPRAKVPEILESLLRARLLHAGASGDGDLALSALRVRGGSFLLATLDREGGGQERLHWLGQAALDALDDLALIEALREESETDELTGVGNYRQLTRRLGRWLAERRPFSLLMIDVDNLKEYNARYGHLGGSGALREIAHLLRDAIAAADHVSKYGGDEFTLLLLGHDRAAAERKADEIRDLIKQHHFERDPERRLTVSIGLATAPEDGEAPSDLLRSADRRLFRAKDGGRDRSVSIEPIPSWKKDDR